MRRAGGWGEGGTAPPGPLSDPPMKESGHNQSLAVTIYSENINATHQYNLCEFHRSLYAPG